MTFIVKNQCRQLKLVQKEEKIEYESYVVTRDDPGFIEHLKERELVDKRYSSIKDVEVAYYRFNNRFGLFLITGFTILFLIGCTPPLAPLATGLIIIGVGLSLIRLGLSLDEDRHR